jgi:hypothetical protein
MFKSQSTGLPASAPRDYEEGHIFDVIDLKTTLLLPPSANHSFNECNAELILV